MCKYIVSLMLLFVPLLGNAQSEEEMIQQIRELVEDKGIDSYIDAMVELSHSEFPKRLDVLDTVTGVYYVRATRALTYKHVLSPQWQQLIADATGVDVSDVSTFMPQFMQDQAVARACSVALNRLYFEHGVKLVGLYADHTGAIVFKTTVTQPDCGA